MIYVLVVQKSCLDKKRVFIRMGNNLNSLKNEAGRLFKTGMYKEVQVIEVQSKYKKYVVCRFERMCDRTECKKVRFKFEQDAVALWASSCGDEEFLQRIPKMYGACLLWKVRDCIKSNISKIETLELVKSKGGQNG